MSMAQLSPNSVLANPAQINPQVKIDQISSPQQINQGAKQLLQAARTDTVTFSQQAVKKAVNDVYSAVQETKDEATESALKSVHIKV